MQKSSEYAKELDKNDELSHYRQKFYIPRNQNGEEKIYLCGNSLGLQSISTRDYIEQELNDWAQLGVDGHLEAKNPWLPYHEALSAPMAQIVGAKPSEVVIMNSLTANLHFLLVSFYNPTPSKFKILIESTTFPSDIYAIKSQLRFHGIDPEEGLLMLKPKEGNDFIEKTDIDEMLQSHGDEIAVILLGGVNYYSGQFFDLEYICRKGHEYGCIVGFDLAHGAGNIEPNLHEIGADFALWCTYKYLNSGPGALSGIFIHEKHHYWNNKPRFEGWWGTNKANRFKMKPDFEPIIGAEAWQLSNPPILAMAPIKASLEIFSEAGMPNLRKKSIQMTQFAIECFKDLDHRKINILIPEKVEERGCQISIKVRQGDKKLFHYLEKNDVIADWREPDVIRIAPVPLYNTYSEIFRFSQIIQSGLLTL